MVQGKINRGRHTVRLGATPSGLISAHRPVPGGSLETTQKRKRSTSVTGACCDVCQLDSEVLASLALQLTAWYHSPACISVAVVRYYYTVSQKTSHL